MEHGQKPAKGKVGTCIAEREELQLLRPLQYCRERETTIATTAPVLQTARNCSNHPSMAEREIAINYYDRSSIAERYVYGDPTTISLVSGMTPWIVEGPESHTRALTPPHASVYRRVCVGSNPPSQPAPRPPRFIGLRFACGGGFVSRLFHGGLGHIQPRSPNLRGNRA